MESIAETRADHYAQCAQDSIVRPLSAVEIKRRVDIETRLRMQNASNVEDALDAIYDIQRFPRLALYITTAINYDGEVRNAAIDAIAAMLADEMKDDATRAVLAENGE